MKGGCGNAFSNFLHRTTEADVRMYLDCFYMRPLSIVFVDLVVAVLIVTSTSDSLFIHKLFCSSTILVYELCLIL